jgi:hypothetical protein
VSEVLRSTPVLQIAVIQDDVEGARKAFKVVSPVFESSDDGKHLFVVYLVVAFGICH